MAGMSTACVGTVPAEPSRSGHGLDGARTSGFDHKEKIMRSWTVARHLARWMLAATAALPLVCHAAAVTYEFRVTGTDGALKGASSTGSFTFDDAIAPVGGGQVRSLGLLSQLSFLWDGVNFTAAQANTGYLDFDSTGALIGFSIGTRQCDFCSLDGPNEWFMFVSPSSSEFGAFRADGASFTQGTVEFPFRSDVPEPAGLALAGLALTALVATRARSHRRG